MDIRDFSGLKILPSDPLSNTLELNKPGPNEYTVGCS
jgi:hypothetical protein